MLTLTLLLALPQDVAPAVPGGAWIDARIDEQLAAAGVTPAPLAEDAEFLRRITLDLTGVVPRVEVVRAFLADTAPDKRTRTIDELLASDGFARWHARWLVETLIERRTSLNGGDNPWELLEWLRAELAARRPYDELMRELITASGPYNVNGATNWVLRYSVRPPDLAGALAKGMLGSSLRCAQCHDHKFQPVTQKQFWNVAAFFARTQAYYMGNGEFGVTDTRFGRLALPFGGDPDAPAPPATTTEMAEPPPARSVPARWRDGTPARSEEGLREQLADFVVHDPDFARNLVNRLWARLFGRGLVEPQDEIQEPASHPELLDELARFAREQRYDLAAIVREMVRSRAYQRSARAEGSGDARQFGHALLRPLTVDQLFQSLVQATGYGQDDDDSDTVAAAEVAAEQARPPAAAMDAIDDGMALDDGAEALRYALHAVDAAIPDFCGGEPETLRHALQRLNSQEILGACDSGARLGMKLHGQPVAAPHVEWVWLSLLSRPPRAEERECALDWIAANQGKRKGLFDLIWVVLNSQEFGHNH